MSFIISKSFLVTIAFLVVGSLVGAYWYTLPKESPYEFGIVERQDIRSITSVIGRVVPVEELDLAFEVAGRLETIAVKVGDSVHGGSFLAAQNRQELASQLLEQHAAVKIKEAELAGFQRGSRLEEIRVDEVVAENKRVALEDARRDLANKVRDAFTKTDDAVRNHIDQLYREPRSNPHLDKFNITDSALRSELENKRSAIEQLLKSWNESLSMLKADDSVLFAAVEAKINLDESIRFLDRIAYMVNGLQEGSNLSQATLDGYKTDVATARTNVNTAAVNLATTEEKVRSAVAALALAEEELALTNAGATAEIVAAAEAELAQARAKVATIEVQIAKKALYSPIKGVIAAVGYKVGEIVTANTTVITLLSDAAFEIEANVPEVDIADVAVGKEAQVTLDAYGRGEIFSAIVTKIDPAETIIEGIATYQITLQFLQYDDRIRSGMTANIDIQSDARINVIAVPRRAIGMADGKEFMRVRRNGVVEEVPVTTGLRGTDGYVEILEGIKEGEDIVVFVKE